MRTHRISKHEMFMSIAQTLSERSTCVRRGVGCVLVDRHGRVLATGYNGVPSGAVHCIEDPCSGANSVSGTNLDGCLAIHAEQNALLQCSNVLDIHVCYTTLSPCITCIKLLLNTSCQQIVYSEAYADFQTVFGIWTRIPWQNRTFRQFTIK